MGVILTCALFKFSVAASTFSDPIQVSSSTSQQPAKPTPGLQGLQDLCSGGLATLTAEYFLDKLLVRVFPSTQP